MTTASSATDTSRPAHLVTEQHALGMSWGKLMMWLFLGSDAMTFAGLLASYGLLRAGTNEWPDPASILGLWMTAGMTFLLIVSSVTMVRALQAGQRGDARGLSRGLLWTALGGVLFLGAQAFEWTHLIQTQGLTPAGSNFGATFFTITGFHGLHVFGGVVLLLSAWWKTRRGPTPAGLAVVEHVGLYWHFVDLVWILVFTFVYLL